MDNDKSSQKSAAKEKSRSSVSFFCCSSTTKKKKPKANLTITNNSNKVESLNSSINRADKDKEKQDSRGQEIPVPTKIDNVSHNTMVVSSTEKTFNNNIQNKTSNDQPSQPKLSVSQIKEEQVVGPLKEDDIHLDVNKTIQMNLSKSQISKRSANPIIDPCFSQEIIRQEEEGGDAKDLDKQSRVKLNLESKFNEAHLESERSEKDRDIALTEQTPRKVFNPLKENLKLTGEPKDVFSAREKLRGINPTEPNKICPLVNPTQFIQKESLIKPSNTNETNIIQTPIGEKAFLESNRVIEMEGVEFTLKKAQKDYQSINNEVIDKQIDTKPMNSSAIVNESSKMSHERAVSNPIQSGRINQSAINAFTSNTSPILVKRNDTGNIKTNDQPKTLVVSPEKPIETLNYINNNCDDDSKADLSEENNCCEVGDELRDSKESISKYSETHSVISSYVLTVPKMISGINDSYAPSVYTRSEYKETTSNFLPTESSNNLRLIPTNVDDTEFEITNENGEGFRNFIETPRTSNVNFRKSNRDYSNANPQFKEIYDKINHKEREIKRMNEKITKLMSDIQKCEEENKKYDRWIEKEESDGEMLRHMLNFLNSK